MPFNPANAAPGVYIFEQSSGVHTITGVATSITTFIGSAARGITDEPTSITSYANYVRTFGLQQPIGAMDAAVNDFFLNGGSQAIVVRVYAPGAPAGAGQQPPSGIASLSVGGLQLVASSPGLWGSKLSASTQDKSNTKDSSNTNLFNLIVTDSGTGTTERFLNLSTLQSDPTFAPIVLEQSSSLVRVDKDNNNKWAVPGKGAGGAVTTASADSQGAGDGAAIGAAQIASDALQASKGGLYALDKVDLFNLLYIPPYSQTATGMDVDTDVIGRAASYCKDRRAFLIVDSPSAWISANAAQTADVSTLGPAGEGANHAAVFFPRVRRMGELAYVGPGGIIAGLFAQTDANRGVWKAPAGVDVVLQNVAKLQVPLNDTDNGNLNSLGINCLRSFPIIGRVVWGSRTLQGADRIGSEYKYIPVRRFALYLEESLYRGLQWVVFEPNDEPLWAQIRLNVGAFMQTLFRQGAFQGKTPKDAYFVKCDSETTTQNDIDRGIVNIIVGFAPLKPAEFVVVTIQQMAGQLQV